MRGKIGLKKSLFMHVYTYKITIKMWLRECHINDSIAVSVASRFYRVELPALYLDTYLVLKSEFSKTVCQREEINLCPYP